MQVHQRYDKFVVRPSDAGPEAVMLSRGAGIPVPVPFVGDPFTAPSLRLAYAVWGYPAEQGAEWTGSAWDRRAARAGDGRDIKRRLCPMLGRCAAAMHVKSHCRSNQHGQIPGEIRWRVKWGRRGRQGRGEVWDWVGGEAAVDALLAALRRSRCCTLD